MKFLKNLFNFRNFVEKKMDFSGQKDIDIFEKRIHFLILCIVLKNETSLTSGGGGLRPPDPLRRARDSLYVAGAFPSPPEKNPGDASDLFLI